MVKLRDFGCWRQPALRSPSTVGRSAELEQQRGALLSRPFISTRGQQLATPRDSEAPGGSSEWNHAPFCVDVILFRWPAQVAAYDRWRREENAQISGGRAGRQPKELAARERRAARVEAQLEQTHVTSWISEAEAGVSDVSKLSGGARLSRLWPNDCVPSHSREVWPRDSSCCSIEASSCAP